MEPVTERAVDVQGAAEHNLQLQTTVQLQTTARDCRGSVHYRSDSDWQDDCDVFRQIAASVFPG